MENTKAEYGTTRNKRRKLSSNTKENTSLGRKEELSLANRFTMAIDDNLNTPEESLKSVSPIYDGEKKCEDIINTYTLDSNSKNRKNKQLNSSVDNFRKSKSPFQNENELIPNLNALSIKSSKKNIFNQQHQEENDYTRCLDLLRTDIVMNPLNGNLSKWSTEKDDQSEEGKSLDDKFQTDEWSLDDEPITQSTNINSSKVDIKSPTETKVKNKHIESEKTSSSDSEKSSSTRSKTHKKNNKKKYEDEDSTSLDYQMNNPNEHLKDSDKKHKVNYEIEMITENDSSNSEDNTFLDKQSKKLFSMHRNNEENQSVDSDEIDSTSEESQSNYDRKKTPQLKNSKQSHKTVKKTFENESEGSKIDRKTKPQTKSKKLKNVRSCDNYSSEDFQKIDDNKKQPKLKSGQQKRKTVAAYESESENSKTKDNHSKKALLKKALEFCKNETQSKDSEGSKSKNNQKKSRLRSGSKQKIKTVTGNKEAQYEESSSDFTESDSIRISQAFSGLVQDDKVSTRSMYRNSLSNEKENKSKKPSKSSTQKSKINDQKENKRTAKQESDEEIQKVKTKKKLKKAPRLSHLNMSDDLGLSWDATCTPPRRISLRLLDKENNRTANSENRTPRSKINTSSSFAYTPTPSKSQKKSTKKSGFVKETVVESDQSDSDECASSSKLKKKVIRKSTNSTPRLRRLDIDDFDSDSNMEESTPKKQTRKGTKGRTPKDYSPTNTNSKKKLLNQH